MTGRSLRSDDADEERGLRLLRRIDRLVERHMDEEALWPADGRLLVGVSGGPDSSALLLVLSRLATNRNLEIVAAYFDHGLRGRTAATEEASAVRDLAAKAGVELIAGAGDVAAGSKAMKVSLEEAARRLRYGFLARVAAERGLSTVAVGHTRDDQAETVLMHILRGSGLTGIAGMAPRSRWPAPRHEGLALVRPLLRTPREETEAYCHAAGWAPVRDISNRSGQFLRNRLRLRLLPELEHYNPRIKDSLVRLADAARDDLGVLEEMVTPAIRDSGEGAVRLDRASLREMSPGLRRHAVRRGLLLLKGDLQGFTARHITSVERAAAGRKSGARLDLPGGIEASVTRTLLTLRAGGGEGQLALPDEAVRLRVPGEARLGGLRMAAGPEAIADAHAFQEVDAAALGAHLCVRPWHPGDRMQPLGMKGTKKLQDLFVDAHVPREDRRSLPVFESERGIVWVGGLRLAEWARPRHGRAKLVLSYRREPDP